MKQNFFSKYFHYIFLSFVLFVHFTDHSKYYKGTILTIDDCPNNKCSVSVLLEKNNKKINMNIRKYRRKQFIPPSVDDTLYISFHNNEYHKTDFVTYSINKHFYIMLFISLSYFLYKFLN